MAAAGLIQAATLDLIAGKIRPGVSTEELDAAAERFIRSQGATPTFKGYRGFPGSICASPNSMVVHGIPGRYRLERGDILSVDIGVTFDGWVADAARTFAVGEITPLAENLLSATEQSLYAGVEQCRPGNRMGDVSRRSNGPPRRRACRSCARWSATASAKTCTRILRCPTTVSPARAHCWRRAWCWRSSR